MGLQNYYSLSTIKSSSNTSPNGINPMNVVQFKRTDWAVSAEWKKYDRVVVKSMAHGVYSTKSMVRTARAAGCLNGATLKITMITKCRPRINSITATSITKNVK